MKKYIYSISYLIILLFASSVSAQTLWRATEYGMTVEQVKSIFPNAARPTNPNHLYGDSEELLRLDDITVVNEQFHASFYFNTGKLTQVSLALERGQNFHSVMRVFESLTEVLRAKYGTEINRQIKEGNRNRADATWLSGRTNINLHASGVGENDAILNINYQVRISSEADKL